MLAGAEGGFAMTGEKLGDGCAGFGLNHVIQVNEGPAEALGQERADGAFAGAHEAGQDYAAGLRWMRVVHGVGLGWAGHSSVFEVLSWDSV